MDPATIMSIVGAGLSPAMSLVGYLVSQGDRERAQQVLEQAYQKYGDIVLDQLPDVAPELMGPSAMESIETDPRLKEAQTRALGGFEDIIGAGGLTAADKAVLNQLNRQSEKAASDRQAQILENMQRRGIGGGGAELAAQLSGGQAAAERAQQYGLTTAGQAQQRALDAIMGSGQLAGGIRAQDFGEKAAKAQAADAINRYNTDTTNYGKYFNAGQVGNRNAQKIQQGQIGLTAAGGLSDLYSNKAAQTQGLYSGMGSAGNAALGSIGGQMRDDDRFRQWLKNQGGGRGQ